MPFAPEPTFQDRRLVYAAIERAEQGGPALERRHPRPQTLLRQLGGQYSAQITESAVDGLGRWVAVEHHLHRSPGLHQREPQRVVHLAGIEPHRPARADGGAEVAQQLPLEKPLVRVNVGASEGAGKPSGHLGRGRHGNDQVFARSVSAALSRGEGRRQSAHPEMAAVATERIVVERMGTRSVGECRADSRRLHAAANHARLGRALGLTNYPHRLGASATEGRPGQRHPDGVEGQSLQNLDDRFRQVLVSQSGRERRNSLRQCHVRRHG